MAISIGCGSWSDAEYIGVLYPPGLPPAERLACYAKHFQHVEVNSSYYATPKLETVKGWVKQTPPGFTFDIKLHRAISQHPGSIMPRIEIAGKSARSRKDPAAKKDLASYLLENLEPLFKAGKFGTFLLTLSPYFEPERNELKELDGIIEVLRPHSLAVEFRHRAWVAGKTRARSLAYFRERGIAWVTVDMPKVDKPGVMPPVDEVTSTELAYLRLHGRNEEGYLNGKTAADRHDYLYPPTELKEMVRRIKKLAKKAKNVRVVCNNHYRDYAPRTALELRKLLKV